MKAFVLGTVFGILICTVGLSGIAKILDNGVAKAKMTALPAICKPASMCSVLAASAFRVNFI